MEFVIHSETLKKALNIVSRVISGKPSVPVMTGVKLEGVKDRLIVTGGDSDISIIKTIDLKDSPQEKMVEQGSLVVPIKYFHELIKKMPVNGLITIKKYNKQILIICGDIETTLSGLNEDDYPDAHEPSGDGFKIKASLLIEMIKETQFAAAKSETRAVLTGVNWVFGEGELTLIATNSQRMAMRKASLNTNLTGSFILPIKALTELVHVIDKHQFIRISPTESMMTFQSEGLSLHSRLITGNYPDISRIIPEEAVTEVVVPRLRFLEGIERANLLASQWKHNNVTLALNMDEKIRLTSSTSEIGQINEKLDTVEVEGDRNLKISFDGKFLAEALKSIQDDLVTLSFGGSLKPIIIKPYNKKNTIHLVSPVRASS
ncbi:DNA polymerase III subunit beta [Rossellomorea vietnamensis]|uniref:Beta sliding clamp n=1 Tax=Rossellomorea vietnamensis TaxID=218284 RepID=A0A5D4NW35_9BACI|nr:DNA polymerase III subunit beta [Rossellomorea vietnamensis]TYS17648.1 DNA polymerase III subunit beta [Rossellomorea vietnamensis]